MVLRESTRFNPDLDGLTFEWTFTAISMFTSTPGRGFLETE